jgi:hypothetical protein
MYNLQLQFVMPVTLLQLYFTSWISWSLQMASIVWRETSVRNYHSTLHSVPEERRSCLRHVRILSKRLLRPLCPSVQHSLEQLWRHSHDTCPLKLNRVIERNRTAVLYVRTALNLCILQQWIVFRTRAKVSEASEVDGNLTKLPPASFYRYACVRTYNSLN